MSQDTPFLEGPRVRLRLGERRDVPAILRFYEENAAFLKPWEPARPAEFYTAQWWEQRVEQGHHHWRAGAGMRLFLFPQDDPTEVIGTLNFDSVVQGVAWYGNMGYSLAQKHEGRGYMREALELGLDQAFHGPLNLHRIQANYMPHNRRSGALLRRMGFVVEGYARDFLFLNGAWEDHVLTSLTNPDWQPPAREGGRRG